MSSVSGRAVEPKFGASTEVKPERMLAGFPWVSAIVLYTLSWGWSLLRPNTLYWDDWAYFDKPWNYGIKTLNVMGRPPWGGLIETSLLFVGVWAVTVATFLIFLVSSILIFLFLRDRFILSLSQARAAVLLFLIVPVNHARISVAVFDYTTSYFLFYLGWFMLVRYKSTKSFVLACVILFLSFKTHSFLFFVLLPFLHFVWLNKTELLDFKKLNRRHLQIIAIAAMPLAYVIARSLFWPPTDFWSNYHKVYIYGNRIVRMVALFIPFLLCSAWYVLRVRSKKFVNRGVFVLACGLGCVALALFPYYLSGNFAEFRSPFEFRADWRSRHQLLVPLGLALTVVGLNELLKWKGKNLVVSTVLVISVALNMFWGSQYFLMSHKQEQLVELFKTTKDKVEIASVEDQTLRFNGRESIFRSYEWSGFMTLAGISTERPGCEELPTGSALTLKSDKPYLKALATRDLSLYFEVTPCSEVLVQND
ncbi:MAG: hypothetical protein O2841_07180 [Actinomycetota bacterium]|nr:hypothetical protein [Actinomycetota bacterium]